MEENGKKRTDGLLNAEEHLACKHYKADISSSFGYFELSAKENLPLLDTKNNAILFIKSGIISVDCANFKNRKFQGGEIILIPSHVDSKIKIEVDCQILICSFDIPLNHCDNLTINRTSQLISAEEFDFSPIPIKETMGMFIDLMIRYVQDKINCEHLQECKQKEIFAIFKCYYTEKELAMLFHGLSTEFYELKSKIFENCNKYSGTQAMADFTGMSRRKFENVFKNIFGDTYANWMLKHNGNILGYTATKPGATMNDLMECCNINSLATLNRICRKCFGCTPGKLLEQKGAVIQ